MVKNRKTIQVSETNFNKFESIKDKLGCNCNETLSTLMQNEIIKTQSIIINHSNGVMNMNKKQFEQKTLDLIEKSQLDNQSVNDVDIRNLVEKQSDYASRKSINTETSMLGDKTAYSASTQAPTEFERYAETSRFAKEVDIDEMAIRKNDKMRLSQATDNI
jgi:hypothetical protein